MSALKVLLLLVVGTKRHDATIKTSMENCAKYSKQESKKDFNPKY